MPGSRRATYTALFLLWDFLSAALAVVLALRLKFGFVRPIPQAYLANRGLLVAFCFILFLFFSALLGLYSRPIPRMTTVFAARIGLSSLAVALTLLGLDRILGLGAPLEVVILAGVLLFTLALGGRLIPGLLARQRTGALRRGRREGVRRAAIYGAGELGRHLLEKLALSPADGVVAVAFLDDDPEKIGHKIDGLPVAGAPEDLPQLCRWFGLDQVIVAANVLPQERLAQLVPLCRRLGLGVRRFGISGGAADLNLARFSEIRPEELLGRRAQTLDLAASVGLLRGAVVLVTGGAGSIGSEICLQALRLGAAHVVAMDIWENGLFDLGNQLGEEFLPDRFSLVVGSVRDRHRLDQVLGSFRPRVILHAAAHKHVPLMEQNPFEAVKNNVLGTLNTTQSAIRHGVERFILISSDKAVNPTNVMGATKRVAEITIQLANCQGKTLFSAVRFGNVLGSHGSVVPLFKHQIAAGGPVTVTHPEMKRYFMTIPEAVSLVLEAGGMAGGGEIFVLDMGQPVLILDLAKEMIRLSGLQPGVDMAITFTGLRPGEKLFEEISLAEEDTEKTPSDQIFINKPLPLDQKLFDQAVARLRQAVAKGDQRELTAAIRSLVPTFRHA